MSARRIPPILALAAVLALVSCGQPDMSGRVALVYGVADYETATPDLQYTDDDAVDLEALLTGQGWPDVRLNLDAAATKAKIAQDITTLGDEGFQGLLLFYFSGHGWSDGTSSYICPWETTLGDAASMISSEELLAMFKAAGLMHVVIILDTCYSGGFVDPGATADAIPPVFGLDGGEDGDLRYALFLDAAGDAASAWLGYRSDEDCIVLSAAGAGELSLESSSIANGFFTYYLLNSPDWADADRDGWISTGELYAFASVNLQARLGPYEDYHPHASGSPREYALFRASD